MSSFLNAIADLFSNSTSLKDYSKQLISGDKYKGKVKPLCEIFQATNPLYKSPKKSTGDFFTEGEGVCHAMCLTWFRDNHVVAGGDAFRQMVNKNWNHFVTWQCEIDMRRAKCTQLKHYNSQTALATQGLQLTIQQALAEINTIVQRCGELKAQGKLTTAEQAEVTTLSQRALALNSKVTTTKAAMIQNRQSIDTASAELGKIQRSIREMTAAAVYDRPEDFNQMREVAANVAIGTIVAQLQQHAHAPGLYMIEMEKGSAKHAVAIQAWSKFMDPNSCEYEFQDETTMREFLTDYFKAVYEPLYQAVTIWSFAPPPPLVYAPGMGGDSAMAALLEDQIH
jgi:hypothetical protein